MDETGKGRKIVLNRTKSGVGKGHKSKNQKKLEKSQRKIASHLRRGKGLATGGFRHAKKDFNAGSNREDVKPAARISLKKSESGKNDAQVAAAIEKMNKGSRKIVTVGKPATLGNKVIVGARKK